MMQDPVSDSGRVNVSVRNDDWAEATEKWDAKAFLAVALPTATGDEQECTDRVALRRHRALVSNGQPRPQDRLLADAAFAGAQLELVLRPIYTPIESLADYLAAPELAEQLPTEHDCAVLLRRTDERLRTVGPLVTLLSGMVGKSATATVEPPDILVARRMVSGLSLVPLMTIMGDLEQAQRSTAEFVRMVCDRIRQVRANWTDTVLVDALVRDFGGVPLNVALERAIACVASRSRISRHLEKHLRESPQISTDALREVLPTFQDFKERIAAKLDAASIAGYVELGHQ